MAFSIQNILILFAAFSAFNIGLFNLIRALKLRQFHWLSVGVILFSVCLFGSFFELSGMVKQYPHFIWIHVPFWYVVGPLVFIHAKGRIRWYDVFHLLPGLYYFLLILPFYEFTAVEKIAYYDQLYDPANYKPDFRQYANLLSLGIYALLGFFIFKKRFRYFEEYETDTDARYKGHQVQRLYLILAIVSILSYFISFLMDYSFNYFIQFDYLSLSILALLIVSLQAYFTYNGIRFSYEKSTLLQEKAAKKSPNTAKSADHISLIEQLDELMSRERLYRQPDIKISEVAKALNVSLHQLSAAINHHYQNNFFDYINRLRIKELKTELIKAENAHLTLFAIASAAGFNSSSSFYRVFKKYTGMTPKQYVDRSKNS